MVEQNFIEIGSRDLVRVISLRAEAVLEIKFHAVIATGAAHFAAEFFHEPGAGKFLVQTEPGKCLHAEGQERFADVKPRKFFSLEDDHAAPGPREQSGGRAAGRPAADNRHLVHVDLVHLQEDFICTWFFFQPQIDTNETQITSAWQHLYNSAFGICANLCSSVAETLSKK